MSIYSPRVSEKKTFASTSTPAVFRFNLSGALDFDKKTELLNNANSDTSLNSEELAIKRKIKLSGYEKV